MIKVHKGPQEWFVKTFRRDNVKTKITGTDRIGRFRFYYRVKTS